MANPDLVEFSPASKQKKTLVLRDPSGVEIEMDEVTKTITDIVRKIEDISSISDIPDEFQLAMAYCRSAYQGEGEIRDISLVFEGFLLATLLHTLDANLSSTVEPLSQDDFHICMDRTQRALIRGVKALNESFEHKLTQARADLEKLAKGFGIEDLSAYEESFGTDDSDGDPEGPAQQS